MGMQYTPIEQMLVNQNRAIFNEFVEHKKQTRKLIRELKKSILKPHEIEALVDARLQKKIEFFDLHRDAAIVELQKIHGGQ